MKTVMISSRTCCRVHSPPLSSRAWSSRLTRSVSPSCRPSRCASTMPSTTSYITLRAWRMRRLYGIGTNSGVSWLRVPRKTMASMEVTIAGPTRSLSGCRSVSNMTLPRAPRVRSIISGTTSRPALSDPACSQRSSTRAVESVMVVAMLSMAVLWNSGFTTRRCCFHSSPSRVSRPIPMKILKAS